MEWNTSGAAEAILYIGPGGGTGSKKECGNETLRT